MKWWEVRLESSNSSSGSSSGVLYPVIRVQYVSLHLELSRIPIEQEPAVVIFESLFSHKTDFKLDSTATKITIILRSNNMIKCLTRDD